MATPSKAAVKTAPVKRNNKPVAGREITLPARTPYQRPSGAADSVSVRMYCHGFGDCFLLTFRREEQPVYRMLIDCGMLTGDTGTLKQVIADIKEACADTGKLDLVVQTHQHKDHISGFNLKDKDGSLLWDGIEVEQVWQAWTENTGPDGDELAKKLKVKHEKKKKALARALGIYKQQIDSEEHRTMLDSEYRGDEYLAAQQRYAAALGQILNFFDIDAAEVDRAAAGADGELGLTMKDAMSYFKERRRRKGSPDITFWDPGELADADSTGLEGVNFYFLGPPKDYDKLRLMEDHSHEEMYLSDMGLSDNFFMALSNGGGNGGETLSPFPGRYILEQKDLSAADKKDPDHVWNLYHGEGQKWRSIGVDWLHNAGALALHLDSYTNNTSLVIAIEFEQSGKVLLFPADAQIGNWISWTEPGSEDPGEPNLQWEVKRKNGTETVVAEDLLKRTVFYKVGHHASHNATARKHGLELMTSKELVAMIPVDEAVAKKQGKKGWKMPAEDLYERLLQKTRGRIIRLDQGSVLKDGINGLPEGARPTRQQLQAFNNHVSESDVIITSSEGERRPLYIEYLVR